MRQLYGSHSKKDQELSVGKPLGHKNPRRMVGHPAGRRKTKSQHGFPPLFYQTWDKFSSAYLWDRRRFYERENNGDQNSVICPRWG